MQKFANFKIIITKYNKKLQGVTSIAKCDIYDKVQKQSPRGVLRNFAKFIGKHLYQACNFIKKETLAQVFSCEFCRTSKNSFSYRTPSVAASKSDS